MVIKVIKGQLLQLQQQGYRVIRVQSLIVGKCSATVSAYNEGTYSGEY